MRIIDLSTEIKPGHVRWETERTAKGDTNAGDQNQVTTIKVSCHSFTHVDAQRHYFGGTPTIEATPLDALVGPRPSRPRLPPRPSRTPPGPAP